MRMRNLLLLLAIVLFASASVFAQRTPPPPSAPPPPAIAVPAPPAEPMGFSFYFDGMNYMGVITEEIDQENMSRYGMNSVRGIGISRVTEGSPAEKAGLKKGDVILQFDSEPVTSTRKLSRLISEAAPEQAVRLTISRNGSEQQVTVKLGQREDASRVYRTITPGQRELLRRTPTPRVWNDAPGAFTLGFGNNRRVGITTTTLTKQLAEFFGVSGGRGLLITSISDNSPASRAGLRAGDVITEVNNEKVEDADDFIRALNYKEEGDVNLTIIRDKSQRTIKVTPERRAAPSFNLSELAPAGMLSQITLPEINVEIPKVRVLQSMPKIDLPVMPKIEIPVMPRIEIPVMPKLDTLTLPSLQALPRVL
jgi:serine protease Do